MEKSLSNYFDKFSVAEWIEQHIKPIIKSIEDLNKKSEILTSVNSWPQRPLGFEDGSKKNQHKN
jgi:hypothetical protein